MQQLLWRAYAKINLCLSVGAPEPEGRHKGWHAIASWMQCIDLFDEVCISLSKGPGGVAVRWADDAPRPSSIDWPIERDLAHRAWKELEAHTKRALPVNIEVVKRIPVGGGLGGGSADAAAVLLGVTRLLGVDISEHELIGLAMSLGSDCGFFTDPEAGPETPARPGLVAGFGDQIQRVESATSELLLIIPAYGCPTGPVYKMFDEVLKEQISTEALERARRGIVGGKERQTTPRDTLVESRWAKALETGKLDADKLFNDLERPAYRVEPRLGQLSSALARATRETPVLTGSGSCLFFPTTVGKIDKLAERVAKLLESVKTEEFGAGAKLLRTRLM